MSFVLELQYLMRILKRWKDQLLPPFFCLQASRPNADLRAIVEPKGQPAVLVYQHPLHHDRPDGIAPCVQNPRLLFQGADEQGHHRSCRSRSARMTSPLPAILSSLPARRTACSVSTIPTAARTQKNDGPLRIFPIKSAIYGSLPSKKSPL